jgi:hypothetical protein
VIVPHIPLAVDAQFFGALLHAVAMVAAHDHERVVPSGWREVLVAAIGLGLLEVLLQFLIHLQSQILYISGVPLVFVKVLGHLLHLALELLRESRSIGDHILGRADLDEALVGGTVLAVLERPKEARDILLLCFYDHGLADLFLVLESLLMLIKN